MLKHFAAAVLDPFCGSGSTLVAARNAGRRFIGIELDPRHHRTCRERLHARIQTLRPLCSMPRTPRGIPLDRFYRYD
jgi:predicted RNA methylase